MACGSTARNGCAKKTKSDSQWHRQSCLCAFVLLQGYRFLGEQLTIAELSSVLSHGLRQRSQEWLCHKEQIRQPVAQAILPVRLCLASVLSILGEQLTIAELSSWLSDVLRQHSQEWLCHKDLRGANAAGPSFYPPLPRRLS